MIADHHLIGPPLTAEYEPPYQSFVNFLYDPNRPIFTPMAVDSMLTDPRVRLGLALRRGPILSNSRFFVHCDTNPEAKKDIATQINRFWHNSAPLALRNKHFGYQPAEVIYRTVNGSIQFDRLRHVHPRDGQCRTLKGTFVGFDVGSIAGQENPLFVGCPKAFWSVFNKEAHRWYGQSLLYGAFPPWYEKWARRGYRDQRQLFFYKYAFRGPIVTYPPGSQPPETGQTQPTPNRQVAQELGDRYASGSSLALPASDPTKGPGWALQDPATMSLPDGLMEYGYSLDDEIWEGMEIPPEVARSARSGGDGIQIGGGGGRSIPQQAYFAILAEDTYSLMTDLDEQILAPYVARRWGKDLFYEIECFGLLRGQDENLEPGAGDQAMEQEGLPQEDGKPPGADKGDIRMSNDPDHGRPPIIDLYSAAEERQLIKQYRKSSDYRLRMRRSA